jgi:hypothetical protein
MRNCIKSVFARFHSSGTSLVNLHFKSAAEIAKLIRERESAPSRRKLAVSFRHRDTIELSAPRIASEPASSLAGLDRLDPAITLMEAPPCHMIGVAGPSPAMTIQRMLRKQRGRPEAAPEVS